jgi:hypothetical protein
METRVERDKLHDHHLGSELKVNPDLEGKASRREDNQR